MRSALGFLTVWPAAARPSPRATLWFAPVGALIGLAVGGTWWAAEQLWPPLVAAALAVAVDAALTGMLHLDGLADSGDGLLAPMDRQRRLAVMRDPHIGAFGVIVVVSILLLRTSALAVLAPDPILITGLWAASRAAMTVTLATVPYARPEGGLGSAFMGHDEAGDHRARDSNDALGRASDDNHQRVTLIARRGGGIIAGLASLLLVIIAAGALAGLAAAAGLLTGSAGVVLLAYRRLGGVTGDVLGAAGVVGETLGLLLAAARW
jgi:adenosylcobinamide-GDP ribazoletransferase